MSNKTDFLAVEVVIEDGENITYHQGLISRGVVAGVMDISTNDHYVEGCQIMLVGSGQLCNCNKPYSFVTRWLFK